MYHYADIKTVHLEITSRCNASCPQCPRNIDGGRVVPGLPQTELRIKDIRAIFPRELVARLTTLRMCGNYGDPINARDTLEAFQYFRACNSKVHLRMFTNGSGRPKTWWRELAGVVDTVRFGIDGLENTNHIYRRRTNWRKIMASVEAFIDAGGRAQWDFIVFRHNEHQVDAARELAVRMGFSEFFVKKTKRFYLRTHGLGSGVCKVRGSDDKDVYSIHPPSNPEYLVEQIDSSGYEGELASAKIHCKVQRPPSVYVSAEGYVFPCCWLAEIYPGNSATDQIHGLIRKLDGGLQSLDTQSKSIEDIVEGAFFQKLVPGGWNRNGGDRLRVCASICGEHSIQNSQYGPSSI